MKWAIALLTVIAVAVIVYLKVVPSGPDFETVPEDVKKRLTSAVYQLRVVFDDPDAPGHDVEQNGSCVAIEPRGRFLTAAHVVSRRDVDGPLGVKRMRIAVGGRSFSASLVAINPKLDLALIETVRTERSYDELTVPFSKSATEIQQSVFAFGFPANRSGTDLLADVVIAGGRISDLHHKYEGVDEPILKITGNSSGGASGGAIVDKQGNLMGIAVAATFIKDGHSSEDILAVPSRLIRPWLRSLPEPTTPRPPKDPDPDGDGLIGGEDKHAWIAQYPDVAILPSGISFQLNTKRRTLMRQTTISAVRNTSTERSTQIWELGLRVQREAGVRVIPGAVIPSMSAKVQSSASYSYHFEKSDLKVLDDSTKKYREEVEEIGDHPWTLIVPYTIQNRSKFPCHLDGFTVNVNVDGKQRWTYRAAEGGFQQKGVDIKGHKPIKYTLRFPNLNRTEIDDLAGQKITIDIPIASLDIRPYDEPRRKFPLRQVVAKCAMLELAAPEARRIYVSAVAGGGKNGLSLEAFLNRVTPDSPATWKEGPTGDYLALFQGKPGTDLPLPNLRSRGMWLIDWVSGDPLSSSDPQRLSGPIREKMVQPGDEIRLRYVSAEEYWKPLDGYGNYVTVSQDWWDLMMSEHEFWTSRCAKLDRRNPTGVREIADKADGLLLEYEEFFRQYRTNKFVSAWYPDSKNRLSQFKRWFPGGGRVVTPQFDLKLRGASISDKVPDHITPYLAITTGTTDDRVPHRIDKYEKNKLVLGLELTADPLIEFVWSPGDPIEISLHDNNTFPIPDDVLLHPAVGTGFFAVATLLRPHKIENVKGIDPNQSNLEIFLDVALVGGRPIDFRGDRQEQFKRILEDLRPRVIGIPPTDKIDSEKLASDLLLEHDPSSHYASCLLYEQLYREKPAQLKLLTRAVRTSLMAFDFNRCIELGKQLPTDAQLKLKPEMAKSLSPSRPISYYREMVAAAKAASELDVEDEQFLAFARFLLARHRVGEWIVLDRRFGRGEIKSISKLELDQQRDALLLSLQEHKKAMASMRDPALKGLMKNRLDWAETALTPK